MKRGGEEDEAIHEIVSLLPFQDEMQDWDRKWDYNEWMSTIDQFLGKPQTIITDYHFDVTQKNILNDLRKAEDDFKQTMIENSPSEIFNQASQILYVSDALFELTGFIEDFNSGDYPEHTYSYEKQISAHFAHLPIIQCGVKGRHYHFRPFFFQTNPLPCKLLFQQIIPQ